MTSLSLYLCSGSVKLALGNDLRVIALDHFPAFGLEFSEYSTITERANHPAAREYLVVELMDDVLRADTLRG